ncbi:MAG: NAD(P)-dependent oxidoreductase [Bacteroidia bacterium]
MRNTIGIRREDLDKKGEQRVAIVPDALKRLHEWSFLVQPGQHPITGENKRAFPDARYAEVGAIVSEDLSTAHVIFGLKEIDPTSLAFGKTYLFFSHTHKGQLKNRPILRALTEHKATLIDYELIADERNRRIVTAFTYYAGYAGMIDTLWALGRRLSLAGQANPYARILQAIDYGDLEQAKDALRNLGHLIRTEGTPADMPPLITCFLGTGKTSSGAREMYSLLPVQDVTIEDLPQIYASGARDRVYQLVLDVPQMYRLRADSPYQGTLLDSAAFYERYLQEPTHFESDLEQVFPYCTLLMNCVLWSPKYPRLLTRQDCNTWYARHQTLQVIGDISCDPDGAIQFSQETWIDNPVFVYHPASDTSTLGFEGAGIAVMAVTNLPCEFAADASAQFCDDIKPLLPAILDADYSAASPEAAGLPEPVRRATILWRGRFTPPFAYMQAFLEPA